MSSDGTSNVYRIPLRERIPKPVTRHRTPQSEEAAELIPIARGEDSSLAAVERQARIAQIEVDKLALMIGVCERRIAETNGIDRARYDVQQAVARGHARAKGCGNE